MSQPEVPTLVPADRGLTLNKEVCLLHKGYALLQFPDGHTHVISRQYRDHASDFVDLLRDWLNGHVNLVREKVKSGEWE